MNMPPEHALLILSARLSLTSEESAALTKALKAPLNWSIVMAQSRRLGVQPLLYKHLHQNPYSQQVPDAVLKNLKKAYRLQAMKSLRIYAQITQMLEAMNRANIPVILLKGGFLFKWVYEDIALRPMSDIDILCRETDTDAAKEVLLSSGYNQNQEASKYNSALHEQVFADKSHMVPFLKANGVPIEVHTNYLKTGTGGFSEMRRAWENAISMNWEGFSFYRLSNEDLIFHLFAHLAEHFKNGTTTLYWFCDLYEVLQKFEDQTDWNKFHQKAFSLSIQAQVESVCQYMEDGWPLMNDEIRKFFPDAVKHTSCKNACEAIVGLRRSGRREFFGYLNKFKTAGEIEEWGKRFYFLWRCLIPVRKNLVFRYKITHASFIPFFYLLHPFVFVEKGG